MGNKCTCPSRKFPCKHVEGSKNRWLMRLARDFRVLAI
ncbi:SWIM zinc finger family protein [Komagataeibacter xylinus]